MPDFLNRLKSNWDPQHEDKFQAGIGYSAEGNAGAGAGGDGQAQGRPAGGAQQKSRFTSGDVDEDRVHRLNTYLRGAQIFMAFVSLCILIALAIFQKKWIGGASGMTSLLLFMTCATLLSSVALLVVPLIAEKTEYRRCHGISRALQEARVGLVCNGTWVVLLLILSLAQTISAYTSKGCKDPAKDPHATTAAGDHKVYQESLGGFCRNKRALAAFLWFDWVAWLLSLLLFLRAWRLARKNGPRIPPFVHPTDDSAFAPVHAGEDEDDLYTRHDDVHDIHAGRDGGGGVYDDDKSTYNAYGSGGRGYAGAEDPLSGIAAKYGMGRAGYGGGGGGDGYDYDEQHQHQYGNAPRLPEMPYDQGGRYR
ncbi:hypothetical protein CF319_g1544 [Tilletia indica]|uniref:MARVEL domain-containing protein n=1 Tax=Tilletia indica TaxID=43049 RepID=A0A177TSC5_9BASI|nr:hypothetical protein CF319_g1544 [Tilletia indica]KAE8257176.1 hypothetical protein A4X13_0g2535 [Tilletia indica]